MGRREKPLFAEYFDCIVGGNRAGGKRVAGTPGVDGSALAFAGNGEDDAAGRG